MGCQSITEESRRGDRRWLGCQARCAPGTTHLNTPRNRFVLHALQTIGVLVKSQDLAHECRVLANSLKLMGVSGIAPTRKVIDGERFGRHDAADRLMVAAAKLAVDLAMPTESVGSHQMVLPDREGHWVRKLFEKAVGGFYKVVLPSEWRVKPGRKLSWPVEDPSPGILNVLPNMVTDIVLDHKPSGHRLVIDTKFNDIFTKGQFGNTSLRSKFIYQMYGYLMSQAGRGKPKWDRANGPDRFGRRNPHATAPRHRTRGLSALLSSWKSSLRRLAGLREDFTEQA